MLDLLILIFKMDIISARSLCILEPSNQSTCFIKLCSCHTMLSFNQGISKQTRKYNKKTKQKKTLCFKKLVLHLTFPVSLHCFLWWNVACSLRWHFGFTQNYSPGDWTNTTAAMLREHVLYNSTDKGQNWVTVHQLLCRTPKYTHRKCIL